MTVRPRLLVFCGAALSLVWSGDALAQKQRGGFSFRQVVQTTPNAKGMPRLGGPVVGQRQRLSDVRKAQRTDRPSRDDTLPPSKPDRGSKRPPKLPPIVTVPDFPRRPPGSASGSDRPGRPDHPPRKDTASPNKPDRGGTRPPKFPPIVIVPESRPERVEPLPPRATSPRPGVILPPVPPAASGFRSPPPVAAVPALPPRGPVPMTPPPLAAAIGGEAIANEVVFAVAATAAAGTEDAIAQRASLRIVERLDASLVGLRIVRCQGRTGTRRVQDMLTAVRSDPNAIDVQGNFVYRPSQATAASGGLQYAVAKLDLAGAHAVAQGRGVRIAIIDSGIDQAHPDLAAVAVEHFDALGGAVSDKGTHGTAIAGIIAARGTIQGVAPSATLLAIRAFPSERAPSQVTTTFVLLKALEWSMANRAGVVNLSLAGPRDPLLEKAVAAIAAKGVLLVAAAGNNGEKAPPAYPAAYSHVIAVTAIDARDQIYARANHGIYIAVAAPGVDVLVPTVGKAHALQSGTSFAAAHISGVLALMLERDPALSAETARRVLTETATDLGSPGRDDAFGAGRSSAAAALKAMEK